jgi:hypothetical protein
VSSFPSAPPDDDGQDSAAYYFVLDDDDRVVYVGPRRDYSAKAYFGQTLWSRLPGAEELLGPRFAEARATGRPVEFAVFYAGRALGIRAIPAADGLAVHVEHLTELNVRTLTTLAESLRTIEAELTARAPARPGRPAPESLQALL